MRLSRVSRSARSLNDDARVKQLLADAEKRLSDTERMRQALDKEVAALKELLLKKARHTANFCANQARTGVLHCARGCVAAYDSPALSAYSSLTQWSTQDEELNARNAEFGKASDEVKYLLKSYEEMQGQLTASKKKNTEQSRVRTYNEHNDANTSTHIHTYTHTAAIHTRCASPKHAIVPVVIASLTTPPSPLHRRSRN